MRMMIFNQATLRKGAFLTLLSIPMGITAYTVHSSTQLTEAWICDRHGNSIRIIDDSVTAEVKSLDNINDLYFRTYITSIADFVSSRLAATQPCLGNGRPGPSVKLIFVRFPLRTSGNAPLSAAPKLDKALQGATCRLDSPWLKLVLYHSDRSTLQGLFIWNERQFLLDQLLLSGARPVKTVEPIPLPSDLFNRYASDYVNSEVRGSPSRGKSQSSVSERIPADVLWLFRNSPQTDFIPFESVATAQMKSLVERFSKDYIHLAKALIEQCLFATGSVSLRYDSIIDFQGSFSIDSKSKL